MADTVVVRMVVGTMSWASDEINGGFAGNNNEKGVEIVNASWCYSRSCCVTVGVSGCTML